MGNDLLPECVVRGRGPIKLVHVNARATLFDLCGDHPRTRAGSASFAALVRLLTPLEIAAPAAGTAISHMIRHDRLTSAGFPGGPRYSLTPKCASGLVETAGRVNRTARSRLVHGRRDSLFAAPAFRRNRSPRPGLGEVPARVLPAGDRAAAARRGGLRRRQPGQGSPLMDQRPDLPGATPDDAPLTKVTAAPASGGAGYPAATGAHGHDQVLYEVEEGVATITLNRPEAMNALTIAMKAALLEALERARDDAAARAVLLTGSGRGFCAGQDLREHADNLEAGVGLDNTVRAHYNPIVMAIIGMPKPVVAAVNGIAAGAAPRWPSPAISGSRRRPPNSPWRSVASASPPTPGPPGRSPGWSVPPGRASC